MTTMNTRAANRLPATQRHLLLGAIALAATFGLGNNGGGCVGADPAPDEGGAACTQASDCAGQAAGDCGASTGGWTCSAGSCEYVCEDGGSTGGSGGDSGSGTGGGGGTDPQADASGGGTGTDAGGGSGTDPEADTDDGPQQDGDDGPGSGCMTDQDCGPNEQCVQDSCEPTAGPNPCIATGCSGQVCALEQVATTCEWLPEYGCLHLSACGAYGPDGACGWQQSDAYLACLAGLEGCTTDSECADGQLCVDGACENAPPAECLVSGCSGEVCAPMELDSICIWLPEYECLKFTECGNFGAAGACGWEPTAEYLACLANLDACTNNSECGPAEACVDGQCVKPDPGGCVISGCNGELCAPEPMVSPCIAEQWHMCLKYTSCGQSADGTCGWAQTEAFDDCMAQIGGGGGGCEVDSDCGAGQACVPECSACPCDPSMPGCGCPPCVGVCVDKAPQPCAADDECPMGWICDGGGCFDDPWVPNCQSDADCKVGWTCGCGVPSAAAGDAAAPIACSVQCLPPASGGACMSDAECVGGQICDSQNYCEAPPGCSAGAPCPDVCYGLCVDPPTGECASTLDCKAGYVCEAGLCVEDPWFNECWSDDECGPGYLCQCTDPWATPANGLVIACVNKCVEDPNTSGCQDDADCFDGQICSLGPCPMCDCPPPMPGGPVCVCPACEGMCVDPEPEPGACMSDSECPASYYCNTWDYCVPPPGCGPNQPCPAVCYGLCEAGGPEECYADSDCPAGQICDTQSGFAPTPDPCDPADPTCGAPAPPPGQCVDAPTTTCVVSGCSSQICASQPIATTCEWLPIYACFQLTECGNFGTGGGCGWQETDKFLECIASNGGSFQ